MLLDDVPAWRSNMGFRGLEPTATQFVGGAKAPILIGGFKVAAVEVCINRSDVEFDRFLHLTAIN